MSCAGYPLILTIPEFLMVVLAACFKLYIAKKVFLSKGFEFGQPNAFEFVLSLTKQRNNVSAHALE